jgi:hypothetical protein
LVTITSEVEKITLRHLFSPCFYYTSIRGIWQESTENNIYQNLLADFVYFAKTLSPLRILVNKHSVNHHLHITFLGQNGLKTQKSLRDFTPKALLKDLLL